MSNNSNVERAFKGVWIPSEVWLCKELNVMEKLFYVEITSLDNSNGCYASNTHFSDFFGVGKARCTQIIKSLEKKNLVSIQLIREGKNIIKRVIRCTGESLNNVPNTAPKSLKNTPENDVKNKPPRVFKILNRVVNKLNNPIKYIKQPYLENVQGSNTKIFNNTSNNKILSKPENIPVLAVQKTRLKKPKFIHEIFLQYPAHRRGGTDAQLWTLWKQEKLTETDAAKILNWLFHAAHNDPQWGTNANGQYVKGLTKFIREKIWLTPVPVPVAVQPSSSNQLDMDDVSWAENLDEGIL